MAYYEWTLSVDSETSNHGDLLYTWEEIIDPVNVDGKLSHHVLLQSKLVFTECIQLAIRGNNKAGLYSTVYKEIYDCESIYPQYITPNTVIDAVGDRNDEGDVDDIYFAVNDEWNEMDAEYTLSKHKLSAVWPTLRQYKYLWKVVADESIDRWAYAEPSTELNYGTYSCGSVEVLSCGFTKENFVNIDNLDLEYGRRYYICLYANETHIEKEDTLQILPMVSECSDGITVDWTPPEAGTVWINRVGHHYQTSTSHMYINWIGFTDIEESRAQMSHDSGIQRYEYALGSFLGGMDVQDFTDVGVTNWAIAHSLQLRDGYTYYATLKAIDFVGLSVKSISSGVTIDTSLPLKTNVKIDVGGSYHHSTTSLSASWEMLFYDEESLTIDTSPPEPGIVYDGERNSTVKDSDYQFDTSNINAYWEGFMDPHSGIVDYIWKIGTCRGCDDVMEEQHVGLVTASFNKRYEVYPTCEDWYGAVSMCNNFGGRLARIVDSDTQERVTSLIREQGLGYQDFWFDLHDMHTENNWISSSGDVQEYFNWADAEPNNGGNSGQTCGGRQDCAQLWSQRDYQWDDTMCCEEQGFICEFDIVTTTTQGSTETHKKQQPTISDITKRKISHSTEPITSVIPQSPTIEQSTLSSISDICATVTGLANNHAPKAEKIINTEPSTMTSSAKDNPVTIILLVISIINFVILMCSAIFIYLFVWRKMKQGMIQAPSYKDLVKQQNESYTNFE
uniref:Uncharacterized protein LOC102806108 n=1 Tax=Saccoglossus kowalevskii TaxID=10224 RepID=A0ABM0MQC0_SACKO|nr:PREDICTED: uncharacterized protein LOC102806108 [Saccoglossus kowalevskii]